MADPQAAPVADSALRDRVAPLWPAMVQRLGERWPAFEAAVRAKAAAHGLQGEAALARYMGLSLSFGPGFEERPENEWALAVLADERLPEWVKLHQLVLRAADAQRRRGADANALLDADRALVDGLERERAVADPEGLPLPHRACDVEALDLRVLDTDWRLEYRPVDGAWQRVPPPVPPSLRIDAQRPAPPQAAVLTHAPGAGPAALLQLRQIAHGQCGAGRHPAVHWLDARGAQRWHGHEARAVSWPVHALAPPPAPPGLGCALVEETTPAVHLLEVSSCGVRDQGLPMGRQALQVWAYPADQWLWASQREPVFELQRPASGSAPVATAPSRVRLEREGQALDARGWLRALDETLPQALAQGCDKLFAAWGANVREPAMQASARLLAGRAALSWGWRDAAAGLGERPLLRVLADIALDQSMALSLSGEVEVGASLTRLRLQAEGGATLRFACTREQPLPSVLDTLLPATVQWRCPFTVDFDPIANDAAAVAASLGPCSGALVGEAGLRPRQAGSGWQWFVRLALEPVLAPMTLHDPVLGQAHRKLALLPAMPLVDWSVG